ncbi:hypothetical protein B0H13DRAFT_1904730 [Mycena leptocephala]|nr:hypothetical protein B0H13DRAFT_1904730 [Mycena leptocephala]
MVFVAARCSNETIIYPIVCAPTCKKETWEDMVSLFNLIIEVWGEKAKDKVGDIWNFATDGDHLRRRAGHEVFVQVKLGPGDKIYFVLSNLPGLNRFTGPSRILFTFDWHHIIKRHCTLLRHVLGIAMDNSCIVGIASTRHQSSLLNPDDPQDVPWAIDLPEAMVALRLKFMSNQLYGDSQSMVKNIVFTVAKQQELDPSSEVNAYHDGHRRRNITRTEIKDHLNKNNFTGDYVVANCDLNASWRKGCLETMDIFPKFSNLNRAVYDVQSILKSNPEIDFLRPLGDGIYPGIAEGVDRSLPAAPTTTIPESSAPSTDITSPSENDLHAPSLSASNPGYIDLMPIPIISFEEVLQSGESEPAVLKLEPRTAKSKNRDERAMGLAIKKVRYRPNVHKPNEIRLLSGSITEISVDGRRVPHVNISSVKNPKANIKLTGQILRLKAVAASSDDTTVEFGETADDSTWTWLWMGSYLMGKSTIKNTQILMDAPHTISVFRHVVEIINPKAVAAHDRLSVDEMQEINLTGTTWALDDLLLCALIDELWKRVENAQMGLREMPLLKEALAGFPYSWSTGISALLSDSGMAFVTERSASGPCLYKVPRTGVATWVATSYENFEMRDSERDKVAKRTGNTQTLSAGRPECAITTKPKGQSFEINSNLKCRYVISFQYQMANKGSATTPSQNVPPEGDLLLFKVWQSARIDKEEEMALGVPEFLEPRPFTNFVRDSDEPTLGEQRGDLANGAGRNGSVVDAEVNWMQGGINFRKSDTYAVGKFFKLGPRSTVLREGVSHS